MLAKNVNAIYSRHNAILGVRIFITQTIVDKM